MLTISKVTLTLLTATLVALTALAPSLATTKHANSVVLSMVFAVLPHNALLLLQLAPLLVVLSVSLSLFAASFAASNAIALESKCKKERK